jgi:hypothetical protein
MLNSLANAQSPPIQSPPSDLLEQSTRKPPEFFSGCVQPVSDPSAASVFYSSSSLFFKNASEILHLNSSSLTSVLNLIRPGFFIQFSVLVSRMWKFMWRCTSWNSLRLFVFVFLSIFFGLLYLQIDDSDQSGAFSKMAVALNGILFISIISLNTGLPNYSRLRAVFYRERGAGFYSSFAYPMSVSICEIPWTIFFCLLYVSINYFVSHFVPPSN